MADIRRAVAEVLLDAGLPEPHVDAAAGAVLTRLCAPDVAADLSDKVDRAICAASEAYTERPDLFDNPFGSRVAGEVAVTAVTKRLLGDTEPTTVAPAEAAATVGRVDYKGWTFSLVKLADSLGVMVRADVPDAHHPDRTFRTSRSPDPR